jgi:hypothetical protein
MDDDEFEEKFGGKDYNSDFQELFTECKRARAMEKQLLDERDLHRAAEFHKVTPVKKEQDDKL